MMTSTRSLLETSTLLSSFPPPNNDEEHFENEKVSRAPEQHDTENDKEEVTTIDKHAATTMNPHPATSLHAPQSKFKSYDSLLLPVTTCSEQPPLASEIETLTITSDASTTSAPTATATGSSRTTMTLRRVAIQLSLYLNLLILLSKFIAYLRTLSLSVLAALTDSLLDVVSQLVLNYTERHSTKSRSSALYPAGAARLEPLGVLTCAALMGMASFEILKESIGSLLGYYYDNGNGNKGIVNGEAVLSYSPLQEGQDNNMASVYGMMLIVVVKLFLYFLCRYNTRRPSYKVVVQQETHLSSSTTTTVLDGTGSTTMVKQSVQLSDPTLEALALDHWNDALSNGVAAVALFAALLSKDLWFLDPIGAIVISLYIIYSWYETGKEQIEQLTGKCAPDEFLEELHDLASNFDKRMKVDVVRAYHFGPKFLVEVEVVLPKDTLLMDSHDLGMELQYEIEGREEVERCFVHIDYEMRPYDEHVVSKVPELRAKYRPSASYISSCSI